jgi:myo-inositol-1(or 4)-monophosphatase
MPAPTPDDLLDTAVTAARLAGAVLAAKFGGERTIEHKGRIDLVTDADRAAEAAALEAIRSRYPDHEILAEEAGASGRSPIRWIVDPLDGTTNFAHGIPHFSVSVAAEVEGVLVAGAVLDPIRDELYRAAKGRGAFLGRRRLAATRVGDVADAVLATGFPYWVQERPEEVVTLFDAFLRRARGVRRFGSAALDLAWVAAGRYDGFFEKGLKPWDMAAGVLIVEEAGGTVSGLDGRPLDLARGDLLAAGAELHPKLVEIARAGARL